MSEGHPLSVSPEVIRRIGYRLVESVVQNVERPRERPIFPPARGAEELEAGLGGELPLVGQDPDLVLDQLERELLPASANFLHPGIMAWVAATPVPLAGLVSGWLSALRVFPHSWKLTAGSTHIEVVVARWLGQMVGFDEHAAGYMTTGGSMANLYGICAARQHSLGAGLRRAGLAGGPQLTAYASAHAHMCIGQSMALLGLGEDNLRLVPVDASYRMQADSLRELIKRDIAEGRRPFCIVGSAGTTNTGAVDPLADLAEIAAEYGVWFHVDGSYGGFAAMDPRRNAMFQGVEKANSISLDPHKWLNIPFEAGCILVKDWKHLSDTFAHVPPYLRAGDTSGEHDHWHHGFELSRADRATKVWFSLRHYGVTAYQSMIRGHMDFASNLAAELRSDAEFELMYEPMLSVVCFRYIGDSVRTSDALDLVNAEIEQRLMGTGNVLFSGTLLNDRSVLRACFVNHRTTWSDVAAGLDAVRFLGRESVRRQDGKSISGVTENFMEKE